MAKNTSEQILRRWQELDKLLCGVLMIYPFAKKYGVDKKTIWRDMELFERLGHPCECHRTPRKKSHPGWPLEFWYKYKEGVGPMFTRNVVAEQ